MPHSAEIVDRNARYQARDRRYFGDREDPYPLEWLALKHSHPANLLHLMMEGYVDDFFGAWIHQDPDHDCLNPDNTQN